jgi:hypothetical protein
MLIWVLNVQWALSGAVAVRQGTPKATTTNETWGRKYVRTPKARYSHSGVSGIRRSHAAYVMCNDSTLPLLEVMMRLRRG